MAPLAAPKGVALDTQLLLQGVKLVRSSFSLISSLDSFHFYCFLIFLSTIISKPFLSSMLISSFNFSFQYFFQTKRGFFYFIVYMVTVSDKSRRFAEEIFHITSNLYHRKISGKIIWPIMTCCNKATNSFAVRQKWKKRNRYQLEAFHWLHSIQIYNLNSIILISQSLVFKIFKFEIHQFFFFSLTLHLHTVNITY